MELKPFKMGISFGIVTALGMLIWGVVATFYDKWTAGIELVNNFYVGFDASIIGSLIGAVWGFIDGFIFGWLAFLIYNLLTKPKVEEPASKVEKKDAMYP